MSAPQIHPPEPAAAWRPVQSLGFLLAVACLIVAVAVPEPEGLGTPAWRTACVGLAMACLWVTEAVPVAAAALVPLVAFPLLGIAKVDEAAAPYGHKLIFLFLGGFCVALAMERWNLHRRLALHLVRLVGTEGRALVLGFMVATALLSMWVSNTATALMMFPIGLSVVGLLEQSAASTSAGRGGDDDRSAREALGTALLLGIAYGANIGGMGTIIGTPPNTVLVANLEELFGIRISFVRWMAVGVPVVVVGIPLAHLLLTRVCFPQTGWLNREGAGGAGAAADTLLRGELERLGPISRPERRVLAVFLATAGAWVLRPLLAGGLAGLDDTVIAIAAALALFLLPAGTDARGERLLRWKDAERLPWGVLILFGGGLSLAAAVKSSQLAETIAGAATFLQDVPLVVMISVVTVAVLLLTELTSNTATTTAIVPVVGALAVGLGQNPVMIAVPVALAASGAFMLPVATPPNAVVFGSGKVPLAVMARSGVVINLLFAVLIPIATLTLVRWFLAGTAVTPGSTPPGP